jgi:hypothetical protein
LNAARERRLLQAVIAVGGLVPVGAGLSGALRGLAFVGVTAAMPDLTLDSHFRYLSGLLLGIGLVFWWTIPTIERRSTLVRALTVVVFVGGLSRLFGLLAVGAPPAPMLFGLAMELVVTPVLCLWQARVARRSGYPAA